MAKAAGVLPGKFWLSKIQGEQSQRFIAAPFRYLTSGFTGSICQRLCALYSI